MQDTLSDLLQQEMSRKDFLTTLGYGVASVVGLAGVLRLLGHKGFNQQTNGHGYGTSAYGK